MSPCDSNQAEVLALTKFLWLFKLNNFRSWIDSSLITLIRKQISEQNLWPHLVYQGRAFMLEMYVNSKYTNFPS